MANNKFDVRDPIFHDEDKAREHLETLLWPFGPTCPRCQGTRVTKLQGQSTRPGVYKCRDCRKPFSVTVGTVFERSHIPLTKWLLAAYFMMTAKKSMSAKQLQRLIGTSYEAAWFLFHRLREIPLRTDFGPIGGSNKVVEGDETYIGGKEKNKHVSKRKPGMQGGKGKQAVFSLIERDGEVRSFHVANVTARTLRPIIAKTASRQSTLMTDDAAVYPYVASEFANHHSVNHSASEYVRLGGFVHTNTIEGYFALIKRRVYGQFHNVSEAHLSRYLAEFDFRHNHRYMSDTERTDALLRGAKGKRLMYRQPDQAQNA